MRQHSLYRFRTWLLILASAVVLAGCNPLNRGSKSGLQVMTNDVPSSVFLDGQLLDKTPYIGKELQAGSYTLRIQPDDSNLTPHETTITLRKGLLTVVTWKPGPRPETSGGVIYEMEPLSNQQRSELSIVSLPDGVIVKVDEDPKEFTPLVMEDIEPGQHKFEVSLPSYESQNHTINVIEGHRMNITIKLAKASDSLPTTTEPVAATETAPEASPEPSPAATLGSSTIATESARSAKATSSPTPAASAKPTGTAGPTVTIQQTNFFVSGQEVLRVRDEAGASGEELGFAPVGEVYSYLNQTENGWYKIDFEGEEGWVSASFTTLVQ